MSKKARKKATEPQPELKPLATPEPAQYNFFFLPQDIDAQPADERDLHDLMKLWRHGRATKSIWQAISDGYVALFSLVVLGAMVGNVIYEAQGSQAGCESTACLTAKTLLPTATTFACWGLSLAVSGLFGPILASAAEGSWLMAAPVSRRILLRGRLIAPVVLAGVISFAVTCLVGGLSGLSWALAAVAGGGAGVGAAALMALAGAVQSTERTRLIRTVQAACSFAAVAVLALVVCVAAGWLSVPLPEPAQLGIAQVAAMVVGAVGLVAAMGVALRRLDDIRSARLLSGGSLVAGMQGAMFALDFGLVRDILVERNAVKKGYVRSTQGRGLGVMALIWRDFERLFRSPKQFIPLLVSLFVPYAADALGAGQLNPFLSGMALMIAIIPFMGSLRVLSRTGGLARSFPFATTALRTALMAVPTALALVWAAAATPAFVGISSAGVERPVPLAVMASLAVALAGMLAGVRWVTAKKVDFNAPMMATESGAVPPTLIFNIFRGFDVVAVVTAPLILNWGPSWSLGLAALVFVLVRGTFNMDDMKAQSEQLKREQEEAKARTAQPKKRRAPVRTGR
ncbi:MAG: DUF6297 family protein [Propionibacteriaceae bacterium]|jgi:hypothetical protein|nr:DUF6297 family protein [Propionibacteriaceae bacterium]